MNKVFGKEFINLLIAKSIKRRQQLKVLVALDSSDACSQNAVGMSLNLAFVSAKK